MDKFKRINDATLSEEHFEGKKNVVIRYYFYCQQGLLLLNEFRYLMMGIFAIYIMFKFDNPILIPIMFMVSLPILIALGWFSVHHVKKIIEYLQIRFTTVWSKYGYELNEERNRLLKEIEEKLTKR